jgi:hypothetical protein
VSRVFDDILDFLAVVWLIVWGLAEWVWRSLR